VTTFHSALFDSIYKEDIYLPAQPPTIVIDQLWETIENEERVLLSKILAAVKHSLDSVTIKYQPTLDLSHWNEKPHRIIYFGKPVNGIALYDVLDTQGAAVVCSEKLKDLLKNDEAKKKLWQALKKQFTLI
jgi:DNA polymerase III psi subunit